MFSMENYVNAVPVGPTVQDYNDMSYPVYPFPTPPSASENSKSPVYTMLGGFETHNNSNNIYGQPERMMTNGAYLKILEQPVEKFRFRYKSEMSGTHGSLQGASTEKNRKPTFPTVQLHNYSGGPVIIRCSLFSYSKDAPEDCRQPHPHRLVMKNDAEEKVDPHDKRVDPRDNASMMITFKHMGIIHTAKRHIMDELRIKKTNLKLEHIRRTERNTRLLTPREESDLKREIQDEEKSTNLNVVCLRFDAFKRDENGILDPVAAPIYSNPIFNLKSAMTGDLRIVRMDHATSPASGGKEIFLLVEKVAKKNIKVQFVEFDEQDDQMPVWSAEAKFHENDVHHQYAIVVKTPPYKDAAISESTQNVYIQLFRPSDGETSQPRQFTYIPDRGNTRKRARHGDDYTSSSSMSMEMQSVPPMILNRNSEDNTVMLSEDLINYAPGVNSEEFQILFNQLMPSIGESFHIDEVMKCDAVGGVGASTDATQKELKRLRKQYYQILSYVQSKQPNVEKFLRAKFEDKNDDGNNLLHLCFIHHTSEDVQKLKALLLTLLVQFQLVDLLNSPNNDGETILHLSIKNGTSLNHLKDLPLHLLQVGSRTNSNPPMHLAIDIDYGIAELCKHFKSKGILEQMNGDHRTALQYAVEKRCLKAVKMLVENGAHVNVQDNCTGNGLLHGAINSGDLPIIEFLIKETKIDKERRNFDDKDCVEFAKDILRGEDRITVLQMLCPGQEIDVSTFVKEEQEDEEEESDSESEATDMDMEVKKEEQEEMDEQTHIRIDGGCENRVELIKQLSKLSVDMPTIRRLYEDLQFGYMLETDAFEDRNPIEFLINLSLTNNVHVGEIRAVMLKHGIAEAVEWIDRLITS